MLHCGGREALDGWNVMDDLVEWLGVQLDQDENVARDASQGPWSVNHRLGGSVDAPGWSVAGGATRQDLEHIARNDPARVLREVEAKRRRLDRHAPWQNGYKYTDPDTCVPDMRCAVCHDADPDDPIDVHPGAVEWPCPEIRDDASVYSDRPGYREEWRP